MRRPRKAAVCFYAAVALLSALFVLLLSYVPLALDDLWFLDDVHNAPGIDAFAALCRNLPQRLSTDTGRLGTVLTPLFLGLFPKWVFNILSGGFFFLLAIGICRLARLRPGGLWSWIALAGAILVLPWYDYLLILTYTINYLWASTLAVWAAYLLLSGISRAGFAKRFGSALLCFVAAWIHEGFGIPLSAAALAIFVAYPAARSRRRLLTIATLAGTAMTALSPAIWNRLFYTSSAPGNSYPLGEALLHFAPLALAASTFFLILALLMLRRSCRRQLVADAATLFFITFIIVASAIAIVFYCGPRTTTPAILFAAVGTLRLLAPHFRPLPRKLSATLAAAIFLFLTLHLAAAISLQRRLLLQFREVETLFAQSPDGQVYIDLIQPRPDLTLFKTTVRQFHEYVPCFMFSRYYDPSGSRNLTILPVALRDFTPDGATPSRHIPGLLIYRGYLIARPDIAIPDKGILTLTTTDGTTITSRYRTRTFRTADSSSVRTTDSSNFRTADTTTYLLITPHAQILDPDITILDATL